MSLSAQCSLTNERRITGECVKDKLSALLGVNFCVLCLNGRWDAVMTPGVTEQIEFQFPFCCKCQYHRIKKAVHTYLNPRSLKDMSNGWLSAMPHKHKHTHSDTLYQALPGRIFHCDLEIRIPQNRPSTFGCCVSFQVTHT